MSNINIEPQPRLPWEFYVEAVINTLGRTFIVTVRDDRLAFVVHELFPDGSCEHGDYCETRTEAFARLYERAARAVIGPLARIVNTG